MRICKDCDDTFVWPLPDASELAPYYRFDAYADPVYGPTSRHHRWRSLAFGQLLDQVELAGTRRGRLLDVGCSTGPLLAAAARRGWRAMGIEIDPETARRTRDQLGVPVLVAFGLDGLGPEERFDLIVMSHWLEHTDLPGRQFELAVQHLSPEGRLLIRLPNSAGRAARWLGPGWTWFCPPVHLHYLTSRSILVKAEQSGMRVIWLRTVRGDAHPILLEVAAALLRHARSGRATPGEPASSGVAHGSGTRGLWLRLGLRTLSTLVEDGLARLPRLEAWEDSELVALLARPD